MYKAKQKHKVMDAATALQHNPLGVSRTLSSEPPAETRKTRHKRRKSGVGIIDDDDVLPDADDSPTAPDQIIHKGIKGIKGLKVRRDRQKQDLEKQLARRMREEDAKHKQDRVHVANASVDTLLSAIESANARYSRKDPSKVVRREKKQRLAEASLIDHIQRLQKDKAALKAYKLIPAQTLLSVKAFFEDFKYVDVSEQFRKCMEGLPNRLDPDTYLATQLTRENAAENVAQNLEDAPVDINPEDEIAVPVLDAKERISATLIAQGALYTALTTSDANLTITRSKHETAEQGAFAATTKKPSF